MSPFHAITNRSLPTHFTTLDSNQEEGRRRQRRVFNVVALLFSLQSPPHFFLFNVAYLHGQLHSYQVHNVKNRRGRDVFTKEKRKTQELRFPF